MVFTRTKYRHGVAGLHELAPFRPRRESVTFRTLHPTDGRFHKETAKQGFTLDRYVTVSMPRIDWGGTCGARIIDWREME